MTGALAPFSYLFIICLIQLCGIMQSVILLCVIMLNVLILRFVGMLHLGPML
jgi:hypothetical protein